MKKEKKAPIPKQKKITEGIQQFKEGKLHLGKSDKIVSYPKQAIAIALSEAKESAEEIAEKKDPQKHGIISVVQSPEEGAKQTKNLNKSVIENKSDNTEEHGIISIVQSPDEESKKK